MAVHLIKNYFETLLENLSEGVIFVDKNGLITRMNAEALRMHGFKNHDEMMAEASQYKKLFELQELDGTPIPFENWPINRLSRGERFKDVEILLHYSQDSKRDWIGRFSSVPILNQDDQDGKFPCGIITVSDVTLGKTAERLTKRSEEFLSLALKASNIGFYEWDIQKNKVLFSAQMRKDWGVPEEHVGKLTHATALIHPDDRHRVEAEIARSISEKFDFLIEYRVIRPTDKKVVWIEVRGKIEFDPSNSTPIRCVGTCINISARKEIEESERQARMKLQLALQAGQMATWHVDLETNKATISPEVAKIFGIEIIADEDVASIVKRVIHPQDQELAIRTFTDAVEKRTSYVHEYRVIWPTGEIKWILSQGDKAIDAKTKKESYAGVILDITKQKRTEEALRKSQQELKDYCEAMPQMAFIADPCGEIVFFNRRHFEYFGAKPGEHEGWRWRYVKQPIIHPDDLERTLATWIASLQSGTTYEIEYRLRRHDGVYRWHLGRAVSARDESGKITKWYGTNTDIHEQKALQEALTASEAKFRTIADAMPQIVWSSLPDGFHDYYNRQWYEFTGVPYGSTDGEGWNRLFHPDDQKRVLKSWQRSLQTGINYETEYRLRHRSGEYRWTLGRALPIRNQNGEIIRWMGTSTDIQDIKKTEAELAEAVRARDEFLSIASHELKTPLTSLKLQAQLHARAIKRSDPSAYSKERVDDTIQQTEKQAYRLNRLVDDMLDVSRIRYGQLTLEREHFDIGDLVNDVIKRMKHQFTSAGYALPKFIRCKHLDGSWDKLRTEQVITNLLTNAIRYGKGQPIEIRAESADDFVRVIVKDHGIGIATSAKEKIFDRFERAIDANEVSGLGLGLFITKQIVKAHGGRIWVESELGKGSSFIMDLPRKKRDRQNTEAVNVL